MATVGISFDGGIFDTIAASAVVARDTPRVNFRCYEKEFTATDGN